MQTYKGLSGNSGVKLYEIGDDQIKIRFAHKDSFTYVYNYSITGRQNVEKMKLLAVKGKGLSTFISQNVKNKYARKY